MTGINKLTYYLCLAGICLGIILGLGLGIAMGSLLVITLVVVIAIIMAYVFYRRINEVMTDDLSETISGKAAIRTLEILTVLGAIIFAITMMLYWGTGGGLGSGIGSLDNGSAIIHFMVWYPNFNPLYDEHVFIQDMNNISGDELFSLERLFGLGYRVRDGPMFMGLAFGIMTILIAGLFAAFSFYYNKKMEPETR